MKNAPFELSNWQKVQVSLLYYFASLDYLKGLQQRVRALLAVVDPTLDLAKLEGRDELLTDQRWGTRNTSQNWADNGWAFLADFELSIATDIARRAFESYRMTGTDQCERGMAELSLDWMTPEEQEDFETRFAQISQYASNIDDIMNQHDEAGRWADFELTLRRQEFPEALAHAPALRLRPDVTATTGMTPVRTGVYLPVDDPHGTPQFCWTGPPAGKLLECQTFNHLGLKALQEVGRADLWVNEDRMHAFVQAHLADPLLTRDAFYADSVADPDLAASLVARNAFTSRACEWIFVEQLHGELETWDETIARTAPAAGPRLESGDICKQPGYYFTPAKAGSRRYFDAGATMPRVDGDFGTTIWQWDAVQ
jgi:hypothetical protein